jgi:hypothetical protein
MAFGQASGPPAGQKQLDALASLLARRGFDSFREARHPFGLTQRQAGGKFTAGEATELIERLEAEAIVSGEGDDGVAVPSTVATATATHTTGPAAPMSPAARAKAAKKRRAREEEVVTRIDADVLASELVSRGWCCIPPE